MCSSAGAVLGGRASPAPGSRYVGLTRLLPRARGDARPPGLSAFGAKPTADEAFAFAPVSLKARDSFLGWSLEFSPPLGSARSSFRFVSVP
jgi:hypothetical protein